MRHASCLLLRQASIKEWTEDVCSRPVSIRQNFQEQIPAEPMHRHESMLNNYIATSIVLGVFEKDMSMASRIQPQRHFSKSLGLVFKCLALRVLTTVWVKKKSPPTVFWNFFPNGWEFLINFLHTYYTIISTLEYKFLFKYPQLWQSYAIPQHI